MSYFLPFYPLTCPKNQNFKKMKKTPGDIIISHKCKKNHDHMLYFSWDMAHDNAIIFHFELFLPFYALTAQKIKISENEKNTCTIILQMYSINYDYMMYSSWDMVHNRWTDGWTDGRTDGRTDGQMDGKMEKVIHRGGCPT